MPTTTYDIIGTKGRTLAVGFTSKEAATAYALRQGWSDQEYYLLASIW